MALVGCILLVAVFSFISGIIFTSKGGDPAEFWSEGTEPQKFWWYRDEDFGGSVARQSKMKAMWRKLLMPWICFA